MSELQRAFAWSLALIALFVFNATSISAQDAAPAAPAAAAPQDKGGIEEIIVTSRKKEESVQDIPIAVTAFSAESLETSNIEDVADIQFNVPNLSFSKTNFSGAGNISLRGVGNLAVAATSENGTGIHVNSAPFPGSRIFETEFYDVDRVEVLRGPQGTLFGRSAPAGALNIFTKKPVFEEWGGYVEGTYGKFNHGEIRAALNVPMGEHFAFRGAGYYFHRDGTTLNTFTNDHIDGRDVYALRGSLTGDWDEIDFNLMAQWFSESDDRMRINKQDCARDDGPGRVWPATIGCRGDSLGGEPTNDQSLLTYELGILGDTLIAVGWPGVSRHLSGPLGVLNPGATSLADRLLQVPGAGLGTPTSPFANTVNPGSLRQVSTQLNPDYASTEFQMTLEINFDLSEDITLTSVTGYHRATVDSRTDYFWASPSESFGGGSRSFDFPNSGKGVGGSLAGTYDSEFLFDRSGSTDDLFTTELRLTTAFDGALNVTAGAIYNEAEIDAFYYVYGAGLEYFWDLPGDPFGSCSVDATGTKVNSVFAGPGPAAVAGARATGQSCHDLAPETSYYLNETKPTTASSYAIFGELYWDVFEKTRVTVGARYTDDHKTDTQRVNLFVCEVQSFDPLTQELTCGKEPFETREGGWTQVTWKASVDQHFDLSFAPNSLAYFTVSTGYKGGGFNPAVSAAQSGGGSSSVSPLFDPEKITAYELGLKTMLFERAQLNLSGFYYDYKGMQISKIVSRTAVNENIDTVIWGIEAETVMLLTDALTLDFNVAYLNTEIQDAASIDTANPAAGLPGWVPVKHFALDGSNAACNTALNPTCGADPDPLSAADGYQIDGFATDLTGNELPASPAWSVKVGAQYIVPLFDGWEAIPRVDYYWRGESWGRIYNTGKDVVDSWQQVDVQMRFAKEGSPLAFELWGKNLQANDDVTGHYFTDATSGNFTNLFILEPRTYGASVRYTFGESEF